MNGELTVEAEPCTALLTDATNMASFARVLLKSNSFIVVELLDAAVAIWSSVADALNPLNSAAKTALEPIVPVCVMTQVTVLAPLAFVRQYQPMMNLLMVPPDGD